MNQPLIYMCSPSRSPLPPPSPSHPSGSSQCTNPEHLSHASNLGWWSVSPLIVYLFQCYSLRTSHPRLLPLSPKVSSVHLCLFFCFAYRVCIFLNQRTLKCVITQSCPTLCDPVDCNWPGSSVHGIFQAKNKARILEWVAISFSRGSLYPLSHQGSPENIKTFLQLQIKHYSKYTCWHG